ncbi:MAG: hypothetical protein JWN17_1894 [Frankiales bacterium]|nr:hypothetical protein [Frankiales bacterium]
MGALNAVATAVLDCTFGLAPSTLTVVPKGPPVLVEGQLAASVTDCVPVVNIASFGMCSSLANPTVAAATSAAFGVLTPMPCVPVTPGPWQPGAPVTLVSGTAALTAGSLLPCAWGGVISLATPQSTRTFSG